MVAKSNVLVEKYTVSDWKLLGSPEKYIDKLTEYSKLSLEQIMEFVRAEITDNDMPSEKY